MSKVLTVVDEKVSLLLGGSRSWWEVNESRFVPASTAYLAFGCPDWGESKGERNGLCTFCSLPLAAAGYREAFFGGVMNKQEHLNLFRSILKQILIQDPNCHTLMIFNAGSFLAMPQELQVEIMKEISATNIKRVVIESRAKLIHESSLAALTSILYSADKQLTVRIGVETQDDHLRLKVLKKGHGRRELEQAVTALKVANITSGGYVMLNPGPRLESGWAVEEACATVKWVLEDLGMEEAYFCSTNVAPGSVLEGYWNKGEFKPATLWMVLSVLQRTSERWGPRVHMLPFRDEPKLLAVPSNHIERGIPESLEGARGCDLQFHAMLDAYRQSMDPKVLVAPDCNCKPDWLG